MTLPYLSLLQQPLNKIPCHHSSLINLISSCRTINSYLVVVVLVAREATIEHYLDYGMTCHAHICTYSWCFRAKLSDCCLSDIRTDGERERERGRYGMLCCLLARALLPSLSLSRSFVHFLFPLGIFIAFVVCFALLL